MVFIVFINECLMFQKHMDKTIAYQPEIIKKH